MAQPLHPRARHLARDAGTGHPRGAACDRARDARRLVASSVTNADGRTDPPLLAADRLDVGVYELTFRAGGYLAASGAAVADPPFLGDIVVRVGIADPIGRYHVPLLLSPYGYSVYRGS